MAASKKKVSFGAKPAKQADDWVADSKPEEMPPTPRPKPPKPTKTKRLTLDIDADLHKRLKMAALERETTIVELARELFEQEFPPS